MTKSALITGCSSGIGAATAREFQRRGWQVCATMRNPSVGGPLSALPGVVVRRLDVTRPEEMDILVDEMKRKWGRIGALINNAGYDLFGPLETATDEQIRAQFETNFFGALNLSRRVIPVMREHNEGVIINIGSVGSLVAFPLHTLYHATKFALHGLSLSLAYELRPFGIRVRLVAPGGAETDFAGRSLVRGFPAGPHPYAEMVERIIKSFSSRRQQYSSPQEIAADIYKSAIDPGYKVVQIAGRQGRGLMRVARLLGEHSFQNLVRRTFSL